MLPIFYNIVNVCPCFGPICQLTTNVYHAGWHPVCVVFVVNQNTTETYLHTSFNVLWLVFNPEHAAVLVWCKSIVFVGTTVKANDTFDGVTEVLL